MTNDLLEMTSDLFDHLNDEEKEAYIGASTHKAQLLARLKAVEIRIDRQIEYAKKKYGHLGLEHHCAPPNAHITI